MKEQKKISKNTSTQPTKIEQKNLNINITSHVFEALAELEKVNPYTSWSISGKLYKKKR